MHDMSPEVAFMSSFATHGPDQMGQSKGVREWWARPSLFHSINVARGYGIPPSKFVVRQTLRTEKKPRP